MVWPHNEANFETTTLKPRALEPAIRSILEAEFGLDIEVDLAEPLAGGLSGDWSFVVNSRQGQWVVKRWQPEDYAYAERTAALQEAVRAAGASMPAHRRSRSDRFVERGITIRDYVPGVTIQFATKVASAAFGSALGKLDQALARCPADDFFADQDSVFSRCKDVDQVVGRYLPACDSRFPDGYRELLVDYADAVSTRSAVLTGAMRVLTHVDANMANTIFDETGMPTLIDLTPEMRLPGYSLGAALYWWAYPWQSDVLDADIAREIATAYAAEVSLPPDRWHAIAGHMLNHAMMELAFPLGCLIDGPPLGARPMEDLVGRMARANRLLTAIGQIDRALAA